MALNRQLETQLPRQRLTLLPMSEEQAPALSERLWAAVCLPNWALQVLTQEESPAVCRVEQRGKAIVLAANSEAVTRGVEAGNTLSAARALVPDLLVYDRQADLEQQAAELLAQKLYGFSSWVHLAQADMLLLELKGSLKLYGGLDNLLTAIDALLSEQCGQYQLAVAPTPAAAMLLARVGDNLPLLHTQHLAGRLAQVPLETMAATRPDWFARLQKLGLRHYGELLRLPRGGLQKRFGVELGNYLRQLTGERPDSPAAWKPPARYQQQQTLSDEFSRSAELLPALLSMLQTLCEWLQQRSATVQRFHVDLFGHKQRLLAFELAFLRPSNRVAAMQKLLELRLEREVLAAPVVSIGLRAEQIVYPRALTVGQQSLWLDQSSQDESWWDSLETIQARLGRDSVIGVSTQNEHRPELAWQAVLPGEVAANTATAERPMWLLDKPRRLTSHEQRLLTLQSRPERIASGWWDKDPVYRDYFVAQVEQQRLWVFRDVAQASSAWFCHGVFR
jgi:protein ImuB